jgi:hypothetical protein
MPACRHRLCQGHVPGVVFKICESDTSWTSLGRTMFSGIINIIYFCRFEPGHRVIHKSLFFYVLGGALDRSHLVTSQHARQNFHAGEVDKCVLYKTDLRLWQANKEGNSSGNPVVKRFPAVNSGQEPWVLAWQVSYSGWTHLICR